MEQPNGLNLTLDFITPLEETEIIAKLPHPGRAKTGLRNSVHRYGLVTYRTAVSLGEAPDFLDDLSERLVSSNLLDQKPDSLTVNQYLSGQIIEAHIDSPASGPVISILGLLGDATMIFTKGRETFRIDFPRRAIMQMRGEARYEWKHTIEPVKGERYSVVFRQLTKL